MQKSISITLGVLFLSLALSSCTWVRVTPDGQGVQLLRQNQVEACQRIGTTTSTTTSRVVIIPRGSETVQTELVDLARNEAGLMGGNAIVPDGAVVDGRQRFIVYDCP